MFYFTFQTTWCHLRELFLSYVVLCRSYTWTCMHNLWKTKGKFPGKHHVVWIGKTKHTSWKGLFAGPCQRAKLEIIQSLLLWKAIGPVHSRKMTFPDYDLQGLTPVLTGRILKMRCRTGRCGIRLVRGSRTKGANDDDAVQLVLLILIRNNAQFTTSIVVSCSAMLVFFGWRSCLVTNFSLLLFRAFLKTYKKDWMSTWRRNACFSRGIVSCYIFFQNTLILVFSRSLPWFFLHCFYTFLVYPCIATLGAFTCHPTEFWIIEPLVFQIFLVFCAYWVDDIWLFLCAHANVMELDHSAESALSFYLAGSRRKILNTVKILPRCVQ